MYSIIDPEIIPLMEELEYILDYGHGKMTFEEQRIEEARREGFIDGRKKSMEEARKKNKEKTMKKFAKALLEEDLTLDQISKFTGLPKHTILSL